MASGFKVGQVLKGTKSAYSILRQLNETIWTARSIENLDVIIKIAPECRLQREYDVLRRFPDHQNIRCLIERIDEPSCLVLEYLERDSLKASGQSKLSRPDIKFIAKNILNALKALHEAGIAHTDVKPDNVLLNFADDGTGVLQAKLSDCGEAWDVGHDISPVGEGHLISAAIFRSPEAMLQVRWSTPTDIWSFGATLMSLIWGKNWHVFRPEGVTIDDVAYPMHVAIQQARYFGPYPLSYEDFIDHDQSLVLGTILNHIAENKMRRPFQLLQDKELTQADKAFICKIMMMDPRDRPTAAQLLDDEWFSHP